MAAVHVFAIDWVPSSTDSASGGGLRSLQIIEALRDAGHAVTFSVPADCRHIRRVGRDSPTLREIELHDGQNQIDLLRKLRPEIVFWLPPLIRSIPFSGCGDLVHVCDLIGLPHIEASLGAPALEASIRQRLCRLCADADLVLTGSEEQNGYWLAELGRSGHPPPASVVPYALPGLTPSAIRPHGNAKSALARLHVTGMVYAWSTSIPLMERVVDWVAARDGISLSLILGTDPGGATDRSVLRRLQALTGRRNVELSGEVSFADAMADYRPGSISLDLYSPNMERRMAVPIRTVNALTHGVPILSTVDGTLMRRLVAEGAGVIASDNGGDSLETVLDRLAALEPVELARMSKAAMSFARREYDPQAAARTLLAGLESAIHRRIARARPVAVRCEGGERPATEPPPHVLVISNVEPHHRELRIDIPFNTLFGHQHLSGYSVWSRGEFRFSTSANVAEQAFDAIWVQREVSPEAAIALNTLQRPFVYDLDDNLLATPGFRPPFPIEMTQTVRNLIWSCAILSCSTARLGQLLSFASMTQVIGKIIVTPNLLREPPSPRPAGAPRFLVWVSSDTPAITNSRLAIVKAIRDFCLAHGLRLACVGAAPPSLIMESDVEVTHVRQVPYGSYLSLLRSFAPAIMACPLETEGDAGTIAFIDGKSDIKMLEALAGGLVGVFSRARPYLESNVPSAILCDNTYRGWIEGLRQAWMRCEQPDAAPGGTPSGAMLLPPERYAGPAGVRPWMKAIDKVRLPVPLQSGEFREALALLRGRYARRLLSEAEFDAEHYLATYPDIAVAVRQGALPGAYAHYHDNGFREGRIGRADDLAEPHNEQVWANLLHTLGDLRVTVANRATHLEAIKALRTTRRALRQRQSS